MLRQTDDPFHPVFVLTPIGREIAKAELRASAEAGKRSETVFAARPHDMEQAILVEVSTARSVPDCHLLGDETDGEIVTIGTLPRKCVPTHRLTTARVSTAQEDPDPEFGHVAMEGVKEFLRQFHSDDPDEIHKTKGTLSIT
jgi:hypothetical protein